ncbi:cyclin-J isoform X4 [Moschus berezovskii]|uniref:cyclin-J isoform X4 n=1 Tax=Moschus berezovskii TaxID=68408 RepID=UPI00244448FD|nr:cyclin-J isoform X4 [Moschus berezovskii]
MELEAQWWRGQLAADIHQALRYKELKLPSYKGQSPQLSLRRYFADLIAIVSNRFTLCPSARHLAVYLLDLFMDRYDISIQQLHLVALSCLLLASKFEEKEDSVPKLEQLNSLVHETDLHDGWPMICLEKTKLYMAKYADYFLEVSLQDYAFLNYAPSLVAAACVASSRIILRLSPTWPTRLHRLTAYSWDFLVQCIERLLIAHDNDVKEANKQRGQAGPQPAQLSVFQTASQPSRAVHFQQPQYLHQTHQTSLQYRHPVSEQPSCQQIVSTTHTSSYTLPTCPAGFQTSVQGLGHVPTGVGMSLAIPVEVKPCLNVSYNRSYQINEHYPCITQCFER